MLEEGGLRATTAWLLSGGEDIRDLATQIPSAAEHEPARFELLTRLAAQYPGDAGVAVALMLNHVTLRAGESLWLAAGNIHAYLRGLGVELMGPSDNVLRGGLTPKHVDVPELLEVLDVAVGPVPYLAPEWEDDASQLYRPASVPSGRDVPFELRRITGSVAVLVSSPAILLVLDGRFDLEADGQRHSAHRGDALFVRTPCEIRFSGTGWPSSPRRDEPAWLDAGMVVEGKQSTGRVNRPRFSAAPMWVAALG